uniref:Vegetative incompatibility protein 1d n=1 Tax=Cryphonectria parasitica TaxID=5116 RepID=W1I9C2_CRYPA|nr:vegetative incompatibility protein 1d [Cryphonectria parasitica]
MAEEWNSSPENGVYILSIEFTYEGAPQPRDLFFSVFTNGDQDTSPEEDPQRRKLRQPVEEDPLSATSVAKMQGWIEDCIRGHDVCSIPRGDFVPTRLLDIRDNIILQPMAGKSPVSYVALSHCWGPKNDQRLMLTTKRATLHDRLAGISMESLPLNFQDAVKTTRALGYDYLWIDSLCIIQDSEVDWLYEAAKMAEVYKYATVTIVPTSAMTCHDGFLQKRQLRSARIPYIHPVDGSSDGHLLLQLTDQLSNHYEEDIEYSWWNQRGWTMQERFLSRRILHFCHSRIYHECKIANRLRTEGDANYGITSPMSLFNIETLPTVTNREGDGDVDLADDEEAPERASSPAHTASTGALDLDEAEEGITDDSSRSEAPDDGEDGKVDDDCSPDDSESEDVSYQPFCLWYAAVQRFSDRILTYDKDKFPATEGLARDLAKRCNVGRYLAGIWENDLALGLLWKPQQNPTLSFISKVWSWPPSQPKPEDPKSQFTVLDWPSSRPEKYRAPSWSWASLDRFVHWPSVPCNEWGHVTVGTIEMLTGEIELLDANIEFRGNSAFGRLNAGHLTLKARYRQVSISGPLDAAQLKLKGDSEDPEAWLVAYDNFDHCVHDGDELVACAALDFGLEACSGRLLALKLVNQPPGFSKKLLYSGIIVQESHEGTGLYLRRGAFVLREDHLDMFDTTSLEAITLI